MPSYDPGDVRLIFGAIIVSGFHEGSMVNVTHEDEGVKAFVGTAGEAAFVESRRNPGKITCRLAATSLTNALLTAQFLATNPGVPIGLESLSTRAIHSGAVAKIARMPDVEYAGDMPVCEWTFIVPRMIDSLLGSVADGLLGALGLPV